MKKRNANVMLIFLVMLSILIAGGILGFTFARSGVFAEEEDVRELEIEVDKNNIMRGDTFNLTVANIPEDANVTWFLDDGKIKFGRRCSHSYPVSDSYEIKAEARWSGGHGNGTFNLCSMVEDFHDEKSGDRVRDLRRGWGTGNWIDGYFYYCGMGGPDIHVNINLHDAIGRIEFWIYAGGYESDFYFRETHEVFATYETITFDEIYSDFDLPRCGDQFYFEADFIVWDGRIGSFDMALDIEYPDS
jgi:hypothetical protein